MQLALTLAAQGGAVHFFDLDQTKPLMRARDAAALLETGGVTVHLQSSTPISPRKQADFSRC